MDTNFATFTLRCLGSYARREITKYTLILLNLFLAQQRKNKFFFCIRSLRFVFRSLIATFTIKIV